MPYAAWHNPYGARRWGRVVHEDERSVWTDLHGPVGRDDLIAVADTLSGLDAVVREHAASCARCRAATEGTPG